MVPLASNMGRSAYLRLTEVLVEQEIPFTVHGSMVFTVSVEAARAPAVRRRLRTDPRLQGLDWMSLPQERGASAAQGPEPEPAERVPGAPPPTDRPPMPSVSSRPASAPAQTAMFTYPESAELQRLLTALRAAGVRVHAPRQTGMSHLSVDTGDYEAAWRVIRDDPELWDRFASFAPPSRVR